MKKGWIWVVLFFVTLMGVLLGWNWHYMTSQSPIMETSFRQPFTASDPWLGESDGPAPPSSDGPVEAPQIVSNRILSDLATLASPRYSKTDRDTTRAYLMQQLQEAGWIVEEQFFDDGVNLYAERPGTDPEASAILVGAHYDTVDQSPGADDNATAVATVLEVARLLKQFPTPRPLNIALFDQEEAGLVGSLAFVNLLDHWQNLAGAVILEMIGYACHSDGCQHYPALLPITPATTRGDFLAVIGDQGHMPLINSFIQAGQPDLPDVLTLPVPLLGPFTLDLLRSDHAPFWQKGIGAVMVTDTANFRNPHYHQTSDTFDTLDQSFFLGSAQVVVNALTTLLNRSESLATTTSSDTPRPALPASVAL